MDWVPKPDGWGLAVLIFPETDIPQKAMENNRGKILRDFQIQPDRQIQAVNQICGSRLGPEDSCGDRCSSTM